MQPKQFDCSMCYRRKNCKSLCPPIAYLVNQRHTAQKERPRPIENEKPKEFPEAPTTSEIIFQMFFFDRLSQKEIAESLYITQQYVSKCVRKHMKIIAENLRKRVVSTQ